MQRAVLAGVLVAVALVLALVQRQQSGRLDAAVAANCQAQNELRQVLRVYVLRQLRQAETSLPTIAYYREHPRELLAAVRRIEQQRKETRRSFAPVGCL